ncbi:MAG: phosphotransferase [Planctomycetaceae bacterium]
MSLNTKFTPGTNLKGDVTGANWTYLLPSLDLDRIVIVGLPRLSTLRALAKLANQIVIATTTPGEQQRAAVLIGKLKLANGPRITISVVGGDGIPGVEEEGVVDLLLLADRRSTRLFLKDGGFVRNCRRILKPAGSLYFENFGAQMLKKGSAARRQLETEFGSMAQLWLTPIGGEMHTATPLEDSSIINELLTRELDSAYMTVQRLRSTEQRAKTAKANGAAATNPLKPVAKGKARKSPAKLAAHAAKELVREIGHSFVVSCRGLERKFHKSDAARDRFGRVGNLVGAEAGKLLEGPPRYLREIARASGVAIDNCRWAYSASGEYSSRKLLFLLFERKVPVTSQPTPSCLVKMTRSPEFNARLEREGAALGKLESLGLADGGSIPRVLFSGTAGKCSVVGESFVEGVPFDVRSRFSADCPIIHSALEWLTKLGETTADHRAASPEKIAEGLRSLFARFVEIFPITPEEHRFLEHQIDTLDNCSSPIPLVFQHGDPGRWNVFATPDDRAIFLDWESAESDGLPLWDMVYLLRSFGVGVGTTKTRNLDVTEAFKRQIIEETPVSLMAARFVSNYVRRVGVPQEAVEPLFYTCWMHRSLRESTRVPAGAVHLARYFQLLRLSMARRESPGLQLLFSAQSDTPVLPAEAALKS